MTTLDCRLMCAAGTAYGIAANTGAFTPIEPHYSAVGFKDKPTVVAGGPDKINAALVGVSDDGIIVAFRGTLSFEREKASIEDWVQDLMVMPKEVEGLPGKVHSGFYQAVKSIHDPLITALLELRHDNPGVPIFVTGHSKGAAVASLFAILVQGGHSGLPTPIVYAFASPKPGDRAFAEGYNALIKQTSYENYLDIVPMLPPSKTFTRASEKVPQLSKLFEAAADWDYCPVGLRYYIKANGSVEANNSWVEDFRIGQIIKELTQDNADAVTAAHCSGCQAEGCAGGYLTGVCNGEVCSV